MHRVNPYMDDLAKEAAESYPLKTDSANWESVHNKLQVFQPGNDDIKQQNSGSNKFKHSLIFMLLLIPLGFGVTNYFSLNYKKPAVVINNEINVVTKINSTLSVTGKN